MEQHNIRFAALQQTKLSSRVNKTSPGYSIIREDRVAFLVRADVKFRIVTLATVASQADWMEQQAIAIVSDTTEITLINVYIPPTSPCQTGYNANNEHLLTLNDIILMGDINAHHSAWESDREDDARGSSNIDQVDQSNFGMLSDTSPTRITANCVSSPDLTLASASL